MFCPNCKSLLTSERLPNGELNKYCKKCFGKRIKKIMHLDDLEVHIEQILKKDDYLIYYCGECIDKNGDQQGPVKAYVPKSQFEDKSAPISFSVEKKYLHCKVRKKQNYCRFYEFSH